MQKQEVSLEDFEAGWFTKWFRRQFSHKKLSPNKIADITGLTRTTVNAYLRGERYPTLYSFLKILDALNVTMKIGDD